MNQGVTENQHSSPPTINVAIKAERDVVTGGIANQTTNLRTESVDDENMINISIDNTFVEFGGRIYQQTICIPLETKFAPLIAKLFLHTCEAEFVQQLIRKVREHRSAMEDTRKRHRGPESDMEDTQKRHRGPESDMEDGALNSHLLQIETRFKFAEEYTRKGSDDRSNLESLIREEILPYLNDDNKKTKFSIVKVEKGNNENSDIFLEVIPHISVENIFDRMNEICSLDRWFVYDHVTDITGDKSGKTWEVKTKTRYCFEREEDDMAPQIRRLYKKKMAELLEQLDQNITVEAVEVDSENITKKDGYDFVRFTFQSQSISYRDLQKHLKTKCQNWFIRKILKVEREYASWIPINNARNIKKEVKKLLRDRLKEDVYDLKV